MAATIPDVRSRVRGFITNNFYVAAPASLGDDVSLLEAGVIDSTGVLEIIAFLDSEFRVAVQDDEILPENLDSIGRIADYVTRKMA